MQNMQWNNQSLGYEGTTNNGQYFVRVDGDEMAEALTLAEREGMTRAQAEDEFLRAETWLECQDNERVEVEAINGHEPEN